MTERAFIEQLERWHQEDQFQNIIDAIEATPVTQRDEKLTGLLARAYNNRGRDADYERALELLYSIRERHEDDPIWHFRVGYAYYYMDMNEEAASAFERVLELDPQDEQARNFLNWCREEIQMEEGRSQEDYDPELYSEEEMEAIESHISQHFGDYPTVFHEIISPDIHVDICMIPPTEDRSYYTLVTMGMGAHLMNVPEELWDKKLQRAELVLCLPPDWKIESSEEAWYWPIRWLKILARMPGEEDTWLGWGHTVDYGRAFAENTQLCGALLLSPVDFEETANVCVLPDGDEVNFYQVIPLYREEMDFKMSNDVETLLDKMDSRVLVLNPERPNFCFSDQAFSPKKAFTLSASEIRPLLTDWSGPEGCIATDRITVDGCEVGYCYREEPTPEMPDSGWRFLAGDETEEYMDDAENSSVYALNTLCNYDPDILPLLSAPIGSIFARDEHGVFQRLELN